MSRGWLLNIDVDVDVGGGLLLYVDVLSRLHRFSAATCLPCWVGWRRFAVSGG